MSNIINLTVKEIKQRYFDKAYAAAPVVKCACGCKTLMKAVDKYARPKQFITGHNRRKYTDPTQYKREWNHRNRETRFNYKMQHTRKLKAGLVMFKGGECEKCGYKYNGKNASAFDLHHHDPKAKSFNVGINSFNKYSIDRNYAEAEKCALLCAICHRLHHSAEF